MNSVHVARAGVGAERARARARVCVCVCVCMCARFASASVDYDLLGRVIAMVKELINGCRWPRVHFQRACRASARDLSRMVKSSPAQGSGSM